MACYMDVLGISLRINDELNGDHTFVIGLARF